MSVVVYEGRKAKMSPWAQPDLRGKLVTVTGVGPSGTLGAGTLRVEYLAEDGTVKQATCQVDELLPFTEGQLALIEKHGTPPEFAIAVYKAVPSDISMDEARAAIDKYNAEFANA